MMGLVGFGNSTAFRWRLASQYAGSGPEKTLSPLVIILKSISMSRTSFSQRL
ncbi:hypothetical protein ACLBOM_14260 [Escherichia coli]